MVAIALKSWLEKFFQTIEVFMSESDIEPGTRWAFRLNDELQISNYGIICLTPENQNSQWILFEAGALSNQVKNRVTPLLFRLSEGEVTGPLSQFQYLKADEGGFRKLANSINKNLEKSLSSDKMNEYFQAWWNQLNQDLIKIPIQPKEDIPEKRQDRELLEEILQYTRNQSLRENKIQRLRGMTESELRKMNNKDIGDYIQSAVSRLHEGLAPSEMVQMKQKIILAAMILKEKAPDLAEKADALINGFPGIEIPKLTMGNSK
jgi:hypothetical protein